MPHQLPYSSLAQGLCVAFSHIKFATALSDCLSDYKKNTYVFVKAIMQPWELYYADEERKITTLPIDSMTGLRDILANQTWKSLSGKDKEQIANHHRVEHPEEKVRHYHNMFCAAIVHPDKKVVLPLAPEPIMKTDGAEKNGCERNASRRLYADARREHPHLKLIVVEDGLASNVPHLSDLQTLNMRYIIGVKPSDHKFLFDLANQSDCIEHRHHTDDGKTHYYRYLNQVQLNKKHPDFKTNFLEYWETDKKGKQQHLDTMASN